MKIEIPASIVKKRKTMKRLDVEERRPFLIIERMIEPGIYNLISDLDELHFNKKVTYRIGKKMREIERKIRKEGERNARTIRKKTTK